MKNLLVTTGIFGVEDLGEKPILLGPWCLLGSGRDKFKKIPVVPSPWEPRAKLKEAADYCRDIYKEILPELTDSLNFIHGTSKPQRYWRVLIGPWLLHFVNIAYDRYIRIENAVKLFPELYTYTLPASRCNLETHDTYDFVSIRGKATTDLYNLKLFTLIFNYAYPGRTVEKNFDVTDESQGRQGNAFKADILYYLYAMKNLFCRGDMVLSDMYNVSYRDILSLEAGSFFSNIIYKRFRPSVKTEDGIYAEELRNKFKFKDTKDVFISILYKLIPKAIPACYIENYSVYADKVEGADSLKGVCSAVGWYFNESFKFFAAQAASNGAKLVEFQHGGGYGTSLSFPTETISDDKDMFYTWGWRRDGSNTTPLSSPYLSSLYNTHRPGGSKILFVGNGTHRYICRLSTYLTPEDVRGYFENKKTFVRSLTQASKKQLLYRPYQEIGWNEKENIEKSIPGINFLFKGRLAELMKKAKLVVIDHQSTSILEALVINVPSVFFWDHGVELIRPEAEEYFDMLRKAGILYRTPEDAARKVNEICEDPITWWHDEKTQAARNEFCRNFALTATDWRKEWTEALKCL